jgi:hypothetical protein
MPLAAAAARSWSLPGPDLASNGRTFHCWRWPSRASGRRSQKCLRDCLHHILLAYSDTPTCGSIRNVLDTAQQMI